MNNQFSTLFKTLMLVILCSTMIGHHWSYDEICDDYGGDGGLEISADVVLDADASGHSYAFGEPKGGWCGKDNSTDNRAYLAFYIITLITALIGFCCLAGETGEVVYGVCLVFLFLWYLVMEGLRANQLHKELKDYEGGYENDVARVYMAYFIGQFCLYGSLFCGLALEIFDFPCCRCACQCVKTVVIKQTVQTQAIQV